MILQTKPNKWSCCPTAWAMALNIPVRELIERVGHDGSEIVHPGKNMPFRGFHSQEMIKIALEFGYTATPIELAPVLCQGNQASDGYVNVYHGSDMDSNWKFFEEFLTHKGVLEAKTDRGYGHSLAYEGGFLYDPDGEQYSYSREVVNEKGLYPYRLWVIKHV